MEPRVAWEKSEKQADQCHYRFIIVNLVHNQHYLAVLHISLVSSLSHSLEMIFHTNSISCSFLFFFFCGDARDRTQGITLSLFLMSPVFILNQWYALYFIINTEATQREFLYLCTSQIYKPTCIWGLSLTPFTWYDRGSVLHCIKNQSLHRCSTHSLLSS